MRVRWTTSQRLGHYSRDSFLFKPGDKSLFVCDSLVDFKDAVRSDGTLKDMLS